MKVVVDPNRCLLSTWCVEIAPAVFDVPEGADHVRVIADRALEAELEDSVREAVGACPNNALSIED